MTTMSAHDRAVAEIEQFGEPIHGPRALTGDWRRFWNLSYNIARNDWKLRFYGSALGIVWQIVRPLMLFGVLYVFFVVVAHVGTGLGPSTRFDGTQLLGCIVLFTFFSEVTAGSVRCVVDHEALVRKIQFPRMVIPASVVIFASFNLGLNMIVVFIFAMSEGVRPMLSWLEFPVILGMLAVFAMGLSMLLSAGFVYFRDLQPIWDVLLQAIFYASPVIIPMVKIATKLHGALLKLYMMNPLAVVFEQFRHAMVNHAAYGAKYYAGALIVVPITIVLIAFALGFYVFNRVAPRVAEIL